MSYKDPLEWQSINKELGVAILATSFSLVLVLALAGFKVNRPVPTSYLYEVVQRDAYSINGVWQDSHYFTNNKPTFDDQSCVLFDNMRLCGKIQVLIDEKGVKNEWFNDR